MRKRGLVSLVAAPLAVMLSAGWAGSSAGAADAPPIEFVEASPVVAKTGDTPVVHVANNFTDALSVTVRVIDSSGATSDLLVPSESAPRTVDIGGITEIQFATVASTEARSGYIIAEASAGDPATVVGSARIQFNLNAIAAPKPSIAKWKFTSYSNRWIADSDNRLLPTKDDSPCASTKPFVAGALADSGGHAATVTATCVAEDDELTAYRVQLGWAGDVGTYVGTIDLVPDDDAGEVELTVLRTHGWFWPTIILAGGVLIALLVGRWVGRRDQLSKEKEAISDLIIEVADVQAEFARHAEGKSWAAYSITSATLAKAKDLIERVGALGQKFSPLDTTDATYKTIRDEAIELGATIDAWVPFAKSLAKLESARDQILVAAEAIDPSRAVAFTASLNELLTGATLALEDVATTVTSVEEAEAIAATWPARARRVEELEAKRQRIADFLKPGHSQWDRLNGTLADASLELSSAREALWNFADVEEYETQEVEAHINTATTLFNGLATARPDARLAGHEAPDEPELVKLTPIEVDQAVTEARLRSRRLKGTRFASNLVVLSVLGAIALWTGLVALYFDKAFGTPRDYISIGLWGFGAQAVLQGLASGIDRMTAPAEIV